MADELNTPNHRYYQNRYNVELAPNEMSKQWILASGIARIDNAAVLPLFASAEPGVWYDPSDLTTLFQDNAGTTPVTTPGQTVGLMLDKSQGLVLGSELVSNGNNETVLYSGAGAVAGTIARGSAPGGGFAAVFTCNIGLFSYQALYQTVAANTPIKISVRVYVPTGSLNAIQLFDANDGSWSTATISTKDSWVTITAIRPAKATAWVLGIGQTATQALAGQVFYVDDLSVKSLAGNHATQATSTQRPTYGINPITGTRNLLTYTEQFDNAIWSKTRSTISANSATAPDGSLTADKLVEDTTAASNHYVASLGQNIGAGGVFTIYAKAAERTKIGIRESSATGAYGTFNLATGSVIDSGSATNVTATSVGSGWYRLQVAYSSSSNVNFAIFILTDAYTTGNPNLFTYTGDGTSGLYIWGAQLELGSTATAYQKVVSQYEVTEAGVQSVSYLAFDGVDDGMVTNTITPAIDKVQVFAGVRKLSDAAVGVIAEMSTTTFNNGAFLLQGPSSTLTTYLWRSCGTSNATLSFNVSAPTTNVITGIGNISGDFAALRINGAQVVQDTTDQGTGNYLAYPLYIGRRGGSSLPFNGRIYSLITRFGTNLTDGQITSTESWVNAKVGAY